MKIMEDNLKISQMPPVDIATGEEMIPCVTGSPKENKSVTVSKIRQGMVKDENYVHTDNNFTTQLKDKLDRERRTEEYRHRRER